MRTLLLLPDEMDTSTLENVLEQQSFVVRKQNRVDDALQEHILRPFDLILLCHMNKDAISFVDQVRRGRSRNQTMIVALVKGGVPDSFKSNLYTTIDDCFEIDAAPEVLLTRLRFIEERANIRSKNEKAALLRTRELERINAELKQTIEGYIGVQSALSESEAKVRAILDTTVDGIITIDIQGRIETFNRAAETIFGYQSDELIGKDISVLMPESGARPHNHYIGSYLETGVAKIIGIGREVVGLRKDGSEFPLELSVGELQVSGKRLFTGIVRDITERRRLEQEILRISEKERQRIGQDLHDGLGQAITGIGLISQNVANTLRSENPEGAARVDELTKMVRDADQLARDIARNLVPVEVESNGLSFALTLLAANSERLFGIRCSFEDPVETLLHNNSVATHMYRIAQEAVSNAVRHGKASEVEIRLESDDDHLTLSVCDNGIGMQDDAPDKTPGMGLGIMQYRSRMIRAYFSITHNHLGGVDVTCRVPRYLLTSPIPAP